MRDRQKDSKQIELTIQHVLFYETLELIITNLGYRTVTLVSANLVLGEETVPQYYIFDVAEAFPITLSGGERKSLPFSEMLLDLWFEDKPMLDLKVYDEEGRFYTHNSIVVYDPKSGLRHSSPD